MQSPPDCREAKHKFAEAISQWAERQSELENSEPAEEQHDLQPAAKESSESAEPAAKRIKPAAKSIKSTKPAATEAKPAAKSIKPAAKLTSETVEPAPPPVADSSTARTPEPVPPPTPPTEEMMPKKAERVAPKVPKHSQKSIAPPRTFGVA